MMEVDHISYIFGSFSRRRQSQEVAGLKRRSTDVQKISHDRSNSAPHTSRKNIVHSPNRAKSFCGIKNDEGKYKCPMCKKYYIEPRVLPCLHTFCTQCLQEMEANNVEVWNPNGSDASISGRTDTSSTQQGSGSGGSGCESDKQNRSESNFNIDRNKRLTCPVCGSRWLIPSGGILNLPPHYLLQHRMVLATLNASSTHLLCDICTSDISAAFRCTECALSLCDLCAESHKRQKTFFQHEILHLEEARRKGINRVRRQVMCTNHPERELKIFCSTCYQVICRECVSGFHKGHMYEPASRAAKSFTVNTREALERIRSIAKQASEITTRLQGDSRRIDKLYNEVQEEVGKFMDSYVRSVEEHRKRLDNQINRVRDETLQTIETQQIEVQKRLKDVKDILLFTDELLTEGTDVEVLSFVKQILKKIDGHSKLKPLPEVKMPASLQFLPQEIVENSDTVCPMFGILTTRSVSPNHCVLNQEDLQNLRVGKKAETTLETRDCNGRPLERGGEDVIADLRHRDAGSSRTLMVQVNDHRDGTYTLSFTPDVSGKLLFSVSIKGQPIKDSPFPIVVRTLRPHHGTFHCCSFCSSGGSKEAACGCGGKMPGGYRGCGHGHEGHPGRRHWSCCGNVLEHSECVRASSTHYQFTL